MITSKLLEDFFLVRNLRSEMKLEISTLLDNGRLSRHGKTW